MKQKRTKKLMDVMSEYLSLHQKCKTSIKIIMILVEAFCAKLRFFARLSAFICVKSQFIIVRVALYATRVRCSNQQNAMLFYQYFDGLYGN